MSSTSAPSDITPGGERVFEHVAGKPRVLADDDRRAPAPRPRGRLICVKTCAAARPSFSAVSAVTGSMFAMPRTPSVPKMRRCSAALAVSSACVG